MQIESYRDLKVWQLAMSIAEEVYRVTQHFPASETYGLSTQARRAAVSIAANIAEGYGRDTRGAYVNFLRVSQGSLKELETHLLLADRLDLGRDTAKALAMCDELGRMLRALIRALEKPQE